MADDNDAFIAALKGAPFQEVDNPQAQAGPVGALAGAMWGIPKNLIESAAQFNPNDIHQSTANVVPAAADTAMSLAGAGAPAAEAGAAGIFGGRLAQKADLTALKEAEKMRDHGIHPDQVWQDTGWAKMPTDDKWRFEIPDNNARMMGHGLDYGENGAAMSGSSSLMFQHPDLYGNYPNLSKLKLRNEVFQNPKNGIGAGQFNTGEVAPGEAVVNIAAPDLRRAANVGIHEMQHGVQTTEGFSPGANPAYYAQQIEKGIRNKPELLGAYDYDAIKNQAHDLYHKTAGEVESRNTQLRQFMSPEERRAQAPWRTQDVRFRDQMVFNPFDETLRALRDIKNK